MKAVSNESPSILLAHEKDFVQIITMSDFYTWLIPDVSTENHKEPKLYTFVPVTTHTHTMRKHKINTMRI